MGKKKQFEYAVAEEIPADAPLQVREINVLGFSNLNDVSGKDIKQYAKQVGESVRNYAVKEDILAFRAQLKKLELLVKQLNEETKGQMKAFMADQFIAGTKSLADVFGVTFTSNTTTDWNFEDDDKYMRLLEKKQQAQGKLDGATAALKAREDELKALYKANPNTCKVYPKQPVFNTFSEKIL